MKLVQGLELLVELNGLCATSKHGRMAVAFWGDGAAEALGIDQGAAPLSIVCNLRMGGTNPREIRRLIELGATVKHSDTLHAKIYLFDEAGVVGSSNASTNGLSLQGNEISGWLEANVLFGPGAIYDQASAMFEQVWQTSKDVTATDLAIAQIAWDRRRRSSTAVIQPGINTIIKALRKQPELLAARNVYITLDFHEMSKSANRVVDKARKDTGLLDALSAWEDWPDMPNNADFVCFGCRNGVIDFEGLWHSEAERHELKAGNTGHICLVHRSSHIQGLSKQGSMTEWRKILRLIIKDRGENSIICMEAGELARTYLAGHSPLSP